MVGVKQGKSRYHSHVKAIMDYGKNVNGGGGPGRAPHDVHFTVCLSYYTVPSGTA